MIPVQLGPEPPEFDRKVRQPGLDALKQAGVSASAIVSRAVLMRAGGSGKPDYWRRARADLKAVFNGCCAYSCFLLEDALSPDGIDLSACVDHFQPISQSAAGLAYEWSNLRWAWSTIDSQYKRDRLVPLDPCTMHACPFELDVGDFGVLVSRAGLSDQERSDAERSLDVLGLNRPGCVVRRRAWADDFMTNALLYGDQLMKAWQLFLWQELKGLGVIP